MKIAATQYSLEQECFEVYVSGCKPPHCIGCHNSEIWDFSIGTDYSDEFQKFMNDKIHNFDLMINNIWVLGGEPLDQDITELEKMFIGLNETGKIVWLFTRYPLEEVPECIKNQCHYIKSGKFDNTKLTDDNIQYGVKLASSNQKVYKLK